MYETAQVNGVLAKASTCAFYVYYNLTTDPVVPSTFPQGYPAIQNDISLLAASVAPAILSTDNTIYTAAYYNEPFVQMEV